MRLPFVTLLAAAFLVVAVDRSATAQAPTKLRDGFEVILPATASGEELTAQSNLWMLEVSFKPMRMLWVDLTDPATGQKKRELVWYLVYKAVHRPVPTKEDKSDTKPINDEDAPPVPMFVPKFDLVTTDAGNERVYEDVILPEAQAQIILRERRPLKNPVEIAGKLPAPTPEGQEPETALYGIVMWRGIDPDTDQFTVYMSGFSSGYQIGKGERQIALRKTIAQDFWRPGDRIDVNEREIRRKGEPRWEYRPDESPAPTAAQSTRGSNDSTQIATISLSDCH